MKSEVLESYPARMALIGVGLGVSLYALGTYIISRFGILAGVAYLGYCGFVEFAVLRGSCVHCYYYGKVCGLGRGRVCSFIFKRGDPRKFLERHISFRSLIPDFLVPVIPLIGGTVVLIRGFNWAVLIVMLTILVLASVGTALMRGAMACRYCAQREIGCPADRYFRKESGQVPPNAACARRPAREREQRSGLLRSLRAAADAYVGRRWSRPRSAVTNSRHKQIGR